MSQQTIVNSQGLALIRAVLRGETDLLAEYEPRVAKTLAYMADNFQHEITRQLLAAHACLSPSHLDRLFREEIGMSPIEFLISLRLEFSLQLLIGRRYSVTEVSVESGFPALRTFERAFKKWVGCTPSQYRKRALQQRKSRRHRADD